MRHVDQFVSSEDSYMFLKSFSKVLRIPLDAYLGHAPEVEKVERTCFRIVSDCPYPQPKLWVLRQPGGLFSVTSMIKNSFIVRHEP
jgi:hypothetical protein